MDLLEVLKLQAVEELDPTRPIQLGALTLGVEASAEAARILSGGDIPKDVSITSLSIDRPFFWSIGHKTEGQAEIFGFPPGRDQELPTAIEVALVRAIAVAAPDDYLKILQGGVEVSLGPTKASADFRKVIRIAGKPLAGQSMLYGESTQAIIDEKAGSLCTKVVLSCLENSFRTSPLKFRFLELYRVMEARFLAEIKSKLLSSFDAEPGAALGDALEALKSEMNQITGLAETQKDAFEACWTALHDMKNINQFAAALFRRISKRGQTGGGKWQQGAALVYQIRCAIVHAGEKDIIFESFPDGDKAIETVLPHVERAALLLIGIELL